MSDQPRQQQQFTPTELDDAPVTASKSTKPERTLIGEAVTIARPAREVYDFWRSPTNLLLVMDNVSAIERLDADRSRWTVQAPGGRTVSWESVITKDVPGEEITWQSAPGADVANSGRVQFIDAGARGAVVRATMAYDAPAGALGQLAARLFQREPRLQTRRDLHRLKQLMETGEVATGARNRRELAERKGE